MNGIEDGKEQVKCDCASYSINDEMALLIHGRLDLVGTARFAPHFDDKTTEFMFKTELKCLACDALLPLKSDQTKAIHMALCKALIEAFDQAIGSGPKEVISD